jgi:hypothetical protein
MRQDRATSLDSPKLALLMPVVARSRRWTFRTLADQTSLPWSSNFKGTLWQFIEAAVGQRQHSPNGPQEINGPRQWREPGIAGNVEAKFPLIYPE